MRKVVWVVLTFALLASIAVPAFAKDKEYQDGTLIHMEKYKPDAATAMRAVAASGQIGFYGLKPTWMFLVKVGDFTYGCTVEKRFGKLDEKDFPDNSPAKVRFKIKGGAVATRTNLYLAQAEGKELEMDVVVIQDEQGNNYCATRKCDPESAAKKKAKNEKD